METKHEHEHEHEPGHDPHAVHEFGHGGVGKYIAVFFALCALTAVSYLVGNSQALREKTPGIMWAMMMAVSCAKASLVILFFMHLKWEANWKYVLTVPASIMSIFLMLMLVPDVGLRTRWYAEERWLNAAEPVDKSAEHAKGESHESHEKSGDEGNIFEKKSKAAH